MLIDAQETPTLKLLELKEGQKDLRIYAKSALPRKILSLIDQKDFEPKLAWIAKTLGASLDETQDALDLIEGIGLITWKDGKINLNQECFYLDKYQKSKSKDDFVSDHRIITHQILNDVDTENRFFVRNSYDATDEETLRKLYEKLIEVETWFKDASKNSKKTIVAGLTMTGANVMKTGDNK